MLYRDLESVCVGRVLIGAFYRQRRKLWCPLRKALLLNFVGILLMKGVLPVARRAFRIQEKCAPEMPYLEFTQRTTANSRAKQKTCLVHTKIKGYNMKTCETKNENQGGGQDVSTTHLEAAAWQLVWSDEFDYEGLPDPAKWGYEEGYIRNEESQVYMRGRLKNTRVGDGMLIIEAHKEQVSNPNHDADSDMWQKTRESGEYTSGCLTTLNQVDWKYGRVEARAKMPQGGGVWPAIWMMGSNRLPPLDKPMKGKVSWPFCGEIDVMEFVGHEPNHIHGTTHFPNPETNEHQQHGSTLAVNPPAYEDFHLYAIEWTPERIDYFYDGKLYHTTAVDLAGKGADNPFRKPHYLLLNFAIGGAWGGEVDPDLFPQQYCIDYVRVYKEDK